MQLKELAGSHILKGVELGNVDVINWCDDTERVQCVKFNLDGTTYIAVEDPSDGYRSYCKELQISNNDLCRTLLPDIPVICIYRDKGVGTYGQSDLLEFIDINNGKTILLVGTNNTDDYCPFCVFEYTPENLSVSKDKKEAEDKEDVDILAKILEEYNQPKDDALSVNFKAIAEALINAGYGDVRQAIKGFAAQVKTELHNYRLENEETTSGRYALNASQFCVDVYSDGGLIDRLTTNFVPSDSSLCSLEKGRIYILTQDISARDDYGVKTLQKGSIVTFKKYDMLNRVFEVFFKDRDYTIQIQDAKYLLKLN